jgi:hypothetical protein
MPGCMSLSIGVAQYCVLPCTSTLSIEPHIRSIDFRACGSPSSAPFQRAVFAGHPTPSAHQGSKMLVKRQHWLPFRKRGIGVDPTEIDVDSASHSSGCQMHICRLDANFPFASHCLLPLRQNYIFLKGFARRVPLLVIET